MRLHPQKGQNVWQEWCLLYVTRANPLLQRTLMVVSERSTMKAEVKTIIAWGKHTVHQSGDNKLSDSRTKSLDTQCPSPTPPQLPGIFFCLLQHLIWSYIHTVITASTSSVSTRFWSASKRFVLCLLMSMGKSRHGLSMVLIISRPPMMRTTS